jgi:predicted nucleic acid-binding Zn ribbon protein
METNTKKQPSRAAYLSILVVFALLILWAFLKLAR